MLILIREFQSPDEEMKKIVLKVMYSIILLSFETDISNRVMMRSLKQIFYSGNRIPNLVNKMKRSKMKIVINAPCDEQE